MSAISGDDAPGAVTACFLVQEGADMNLQNSKGLTPLQLSPSHVLAYGGRYVSRTYPYWLSSIVLTSVYKSPFGNLNALIHL